MELGFTVRRFLLSCSRLSPGGQLVFHQLAITFQKDDALTVHALHDEALAAKEAATHLSTIISGLPCTTVANRRFPACAESHAMLRVDIVSLTVR